MKKITITAILLMISSTLYANETIIGKSSISNYFGKGTQHGCAVVRNKDKFQQALVLYGWNTQREAIPMLNWETEVAIISTGDDMEYVSSEIDDVNNTVTVKWKTKIIDSGPTHGPGGTISWGGRVAQNQTMVVILPRENVINKKVFCQNSV